MTEVAKAAPERVIYGNFTLTAQLPNGRSINVAGYVYSDDDVAAVNARLDLYQECIERQRHRCELPELEGKREALIQALTQVKESLAELEKRQHAGKKLSTQEQMNLRNAGINVKKIAEEIAKGETAIAEAKRKAGIAG